MGNALGLTTFETIETVSGWNFAVLNLFATRWWASQWFRFKADDITDETILAMRFLGLMLAYGRSLQYLTNTGKDLELKYKGYMLSCAVWLGAAGLVILGWDVIDPMVATTNLVFYLGMGGTYLVLAPGIRKNVGNDKKE